MKQVTKEQAIKIYDSKIWEKWSDEQVVRFQLFQDRLCVPFQIFHKSMNAVLNRPVYTHEFAFHKQLIEEYLGNKKPPTFKEILRLIPTETLIIVNQ